MNILFVEDDDEKAQRIIESVRSDFPQAHLVRERSFNSGLRVLAARAASFNLVLLDMTLPTYDTTPSETGGGHVEHFAGRDLLAQMELRHLRIPTVVVTMLDSFGEGTKKASLETLMQELEDQYSSNFVGHVYYNATEEGWRGALRKMIQAHARLS